MEMTSERLNTLSEVLKKAEESHSYNNTQLLSEILENWAAGKYSTLSLENWFAAPHSTKEPYQLTVSERKKIAEKVYLEGKLISLDDVLAEYEKMFTNPEMLTYDRYVALAYYLTSGQNKTDSYHFQTFYSLPYFPTEATDKATAAYLISESHANLHTFADQLKYERTLKHQKSIF